MSLLTHVGGLGFVNFGVPSAQLLPNGVVGAVRLVLDGVEEDFGVVLRSGPPQHPASRLLGQVQSSRSTGPVSGVAVWR